MLTATLGMFFQAVKGEKRWAVLARPADLHKPTRKRPEQAGVSTPECLPTRGSCFYNTAKLASVKNPSNIPAA